MKGRILKLARRDSKKIINSIGFEQTVFVSSDGNEFFPLKAVHKKISLPVLDAEGNTYISQTTTLLLSEEDLIFLKLPYRAKRTNKITLKDFKFVCESEFGGFETYCVKSVYPSENIGVITVLLIEQKFDFNESNIKEI